MTDKRQANACVDRLATSMAGLAFYCSMLNRPSGLFGVGSRQRELKVGSW